MHYKFLHTSHIDNVLRDNTIMIASLRYYRGREPVEGAWIGDRLEGSSESIVNNRLVASENTPELEMLNRAGLRLKVSKNWGQIVMQGNNRIIRVLPYDLFIYCASFGNVRQLIEDMCIKSEHPYDACLKVRSMHRLERRIFETGRVRELSCAVSEVFDRGQLAPVQYEQLSRNIEDDPVIQPSAFKKDLRFKAQAESRITLVPKCVIEKNRLIIELPGCKTLFEEVFRDFRREDATDIGLGNAETARTVPTYFA